MTINETELVEHAKQGDSTSFGELYALYSRDLYRFAYYYLGIGSEAEDAVQEAMIDAFRGISSLRENSSFKSWLFKILANQCKKQIKNISRQRQNQSIDEIINLESEDIGPDLSLAVDIRDAVCALKNDERVILLLSVIGGYSSREIASILGRPEGSVRSRLSRTLQKLRLTVQKE